MMVLLMMMLMMFWLLMIVMLMVLVMLMMMMFLFLNLDRLFFYILMIAVKGFSLDHGSFFLSFLSGRHLVIWFHRDFLFIIGRFQSNRSPFILFNDLVDGGGNRLLTMMPMMLVLMMLMMLVLMMFMVFVLMMCMFVMFVGVMMVMLFLVFMLLSRFMDLNRLDIHIWIVLLDVLLYILGFFAVSAWHFHLQAGYQTCGVIDVGIHANQILGADAVFTGDGFESVVPLYNMDFHKS